MAVTELIWTRVAPTFARESDATKVFLECAASLAKSDNSLTSLSEIRTKFLGRRLRCAADAQPLRVAIGVLCDLRAQGWSVRVRAGTVDICYPESSVNSFTEEKERVRAGHLIERNNQLCQAATRRFVRDMERVRLWRGQWKSIFSLMRDGRELAAELARAAAISNMTLRTMSLKHCIDPYLQVVDADSICEHTGVRLTDIWRYFRHTWTTSYNSTPGRKIRLLVRDRAAPNHAVIGIAALGSAVVQLKPRDQWVGWSASEFVAQLRTAPSKAWAEWLNDSLTALLGAIYCGDFLKQRLLGRGDLETPTVRSIRRLRKAGVRARKAHVLHWKTGGHKAATQRPEKSDWKAQARTYLFRAKRAEMLATLLEAKLSVRKAGFVEPTRSALESVLRSSAGSRAVRTVLRHIKASRVGVNVLDVIVCGAIAPYTSILGGKLVALLMASPEVRMAYEKRYKNAISLIASAMAGRPVRRRPKLVLLGTTSLYGRHSSQYNRLRLPLNGSTGAPNGEMRFEMLGRTEGYGSFHFTSETMDDMELLLRHRQEGRRVNSIFGEGVNPKLRKVRSALDHIGLPSDVLLRHGSPRVVYGLPLATNFRDILLGLRARPKYSLGSVRPSAGTAMIVDYWIERWLSMRVEQPDVLDIVKTHSKAHPVQHGARVTLPELDSEAPLFAGSANRF